VSWTPLEATPHAAEPSTLEHFLTERDALYGRARDSQVYRVRVHHAPWPLRKARLEGLETTIPRAAGIDVGAPMDLVLATSGVAVETFAKERVRLPSR
jgi:uncharacterized protein YqjF (DUF2071 family)